MATIHYMTSLGNTGRCFGNAGNTHVVFVVKGALTTSPTTFFRFVGVVN